MSVPDSIRTATPPPNWLQNAWDGARRRGLGTMMLDEINAEIGAYRSETRAAAPEVK